MNPSRLRQSCNSSSRPSPAKRDASRDPLRYGFFLDSGYPLLADSGMTSSAIAPRGLSLRRMDQGLWPNPPELLGDATYNMVQYLETVVPVGLAGGKLWNDSNRWSLTVTHGCQWQ